MLTVSFTYECNMNAYLLGMMSDCVWNRTSMIMVMHMSQLKILTSLTPGVC